ncbi:hypothetical protein OB74_15815 [Salmonella enterica]|nr:hypothetical protein [Salmonella enterica]EDT7282291.1 hypothetical protein [Salmonella enterica subsp. enterica]EDW1725540.1 hypothetical protein [Salmonella enterica subsp. enterica]
MTEEIPTQRNFSYHGFCLYIVVLNFLNPEFPATGRVGIYYIYNKANLLIFFISRIALIFSGRISFSCEKLRACYYLK